jgi:hypothetical protein
VKVFSPAGERYRNGERTSPGFVESTVNQVVSKRMRKTADGVDQEKERVLLLQGRTRALNGELEETFRRWYLKCRPELPAALRTGA